MRASVKTAAIAAFAAISAFAVERATALPSAPTATVGQPAPGFGAPDIAGKVVRLGDYAGKTIVLEWTNDGCPFVGKHYDSGNMQALQRRYTAAGVVWLTVASSAPGEQGYVTHPKPRPISRARRPRQPISCLTPTVSSAASMMLVRPRIW